MASNNPEEFLATSYDFFKIIFDKNPANKKLEFPKRFVRLYGETLWNVVFLRPQCGPEWKIQVLKRNGKVWLQKGWPEFAKYFSIDHGHLLFFRYKGNSVFEVSICDVSTCQIHYPDQHENNGNPKVDKLKETEDDNFVQSSDPSTLNSHTEKESSPPSSPPHKRRKAAAGKSGVLNVTIRRGRKSKVLPRKEQSPAPEREREHEPRRPFFIIVMKPLFIINRYDFQIPTKFWRKHLNSMTGGALLHVSGGGAWPVKIFVREFGRPRASFQKTGWENFVKDNKLKLGDTCTFELINVGNEVSFKVSISRAAVASGGQPVQECPNTGAKIKRGRRTSEYLRYTRAFAESSKFSSANPFFRAIVAKGQNYALRVPAAFANRYFEKKARIITLEAVKRSWTVKLVACASGNFLCKGFHSFVKENSLHPGDVCVFELIERNKDVLKVSFFRNTV